MTASIARLQRFPVKGLSAESLTRVVLSQGEGLPGDRRFALHVGVAPFDPHAPLWQPKTNFLTLMRDERLARLATRYDPGSGVLTIERDGKRVARGDLGDAAGRAVIEQFFAAYLGGTLRRTPRVVSAPGHMFSDVAAKVVSIVGLESVRDMERVLGVPVDPVRLRANIHVEALPAWSEFAWVGQEIRIGAARLRVLERIERCAATNVDPASGQRDLNIPRTLQDAFGHADCGVYAEVLDGGEIALGDVVGPAPVAA
ncbi:MAG: MOSC domain-containing protein [Rhodospirillales bacterium]